MHPTRNDLDEKIRRKVGALLQSRLADAIDLLQLATLWREQGALSGVTVVVDIKDAFERARAETLLRGAATRVLPGWNAVALDGIGVISGATPEARAALSSEAAVALP